MNPNIFRQYDIRGIADTDLNDETIAKIGRAIATHLGGQGMTSMVIGRDARTSSDRIRDTLISALTSCGMNVTDVGVTATPLVYFAVAHLKKDAGVMITGSHNPKEFNGLKICVGLGALYGEEIQELRVIAEKGKFQTGEGAVESRDVHPLYIDHIVANLKVSRKIKVVVDSGNGTGGLIGPELYEALGCEVHALFSEPDGNFPNHHPDPSEEKNLKHLKAEVARLGADIGIAFDGDADRLGVVTDDGQTIEGDKLLLLFARDVLSRNPGGTIIGDVKCSKILFDDIKQHGGVPVMSQTGHSLIKAKIKETNALLAGELSGHFFFRENYYGFDDGIYAGSRMLSILANTNKKASELLADVPKLFSTPEIKLDCSDDKKFDIVARAVASFKEKYDVIDIDGARVEFPDGWGLVRASNTQPVLVMRFEAASEKRLKEIQNIVETTVREVSSQ